MATSREQPGLQKTVLDLCWGAWSELGVSAWARTHEDWAIDPEPLLVFTSAISEWDPRLRDEALDWCIHYWRHISQIRLRNILNNEWAETPRGWGQFAATVNANARTRWPDETDELASYRTTGRSTLRPLTEPSLVLLRMRAIFGLGARAEILRYFLFHPDSRPSALALSTHTSYGKRNVADACDALVQAGLLTSRFVRGRNTYRLQDPQSLQVFVGPAAAIAPDWNALFRVLWTIVVLEERRRRLPSKAFMVEAHNAAADVSDDLDLLDIEGPRPRPGAGFVDEWTEWSEALCSDLGSARWPDGTSPSNSAVVASPKRG